MKKVTLDKIIKILEEDDDGLQMEQTIIKQAKAPLVRMLELSR